MKRVPPAERLRAFRMSRGETLSVLAAQLGITKGWLSLIERGITAPGSLRLGLRIEQLTGIATDEWPAPERKKRRNDAAA